MAGAVGFSDEPKTTASGDRCRWGVGNAVDYLAAASKVGWFRCRRDFGSERLGKPNWCRVV